MSTGTGDGFSAVSPRGDLIFRAATSGAQLLRVTPAGVATPILPDTLAFEHPRASPDGSRIAMSITRPGTQAIWILEVATGILSPLSPDNQGEYRDRPEWSPDGRTVYYRVNRGGGNYFAARPVDRSADERPVPSPHLSVNELVPSPDGRVFMARTSGGALGAQDVVWWNAGDTVPHFLTNDAAFELGPRFSPDGRWFTYTTEIEGRREAYVGAFPGPGGNVQVSRGGASPAVWSRDGRTLYYGQGGAMMAATMRLGAAPTVESTRVLFRGDYRFDSGYHAAFDVAPNGDFIIIRPLRESQTIVARGIQAAWRGGR
jgi:Tol biopolymer transport system component